MLFGFCIVPDFAPLIFKTFAVAYLWEKDPEFRQDLLASGGSCLPHLAVAHELAGENLSRSTLQNYGLMVMSPEEVFTTT